MKQEFTMFIVGILKTHQHRGIGTDLLSAVIKKFSDSNEIFVETSCRNYPAQKLYQKCGFKYYDMRYILHRVGKGY